MEKHFEFTDEDFEQQFSNATLNPTVFTHEAHLRLAWIHIRKYGIFSAIENICNQLQNYVASLGASDKYNKTVTMAAVKAVYHFMLKSKEDDFQVFISENQRLKTNFKELLNTHYSTDIFKSAKAKKEFLEPELLPFDEQW